VRKRNFYRPVSSRGDPQGFFQGCHQRCNIQCVTDFGISVS
jgi:hypothetical protein